MEWYYILGVISYGIFIVQFILSNFGWGDTDLDVDFDGEADFSVSDLVSFKGLVHFVMGFSSWLMITGKITAATVSIAVLVGLIFVFILYLVYKLCMKLNSEPTVKQGSDLVGKKVIVYSVLSEGKCMCFPMNESYYEIICKCTTPVKPGEIRTIDSFESGVYQIS